MFNTVPGKLTLTAIAFVTLSALGGCATSGSSSAQIESGMTQAKAQLKEKVQSQTEPKTTLFEVHHDGRIHLFYDMDTYREFLSLGETSFRLTRIGVGPAGETVVFGLPKKDKTLGAETTAAKIWDGNMTAEAPFYGELRRDGRIYVCSNYAEMKNVRELGHPNLMYTDIGSGPKGETVVYVLNEENKKEKPLAMIAAFKAFNP